MLTIQSLSLSSSSSRMVKGSAEARIEFRSHGSHGSDSVFFPKITDCAKEGSGTLEISKKFSLRRFLFPQKGRRKEKDLDTTNKPYLADDLVHKRIADVDMEHLVDQPQGLEYDEWLATHTISFFEHLNLIYGAVSEYCTATGCASMSAPNNMQYLWLDPRGKKVKCAAPQYVEYVMTTTQETVTDEANFPTKYGNTFPDSFEATVKKIHTWLFHVLAHIYHAHYKEILQLSLHGHLNTFFLHFSMFNKRYRLLDDKETEVLDDLYQKLRHPATVTTTTTSAPTTPSSCAESREDSSPGGKEAAGNGGPMGDMDVTMTTPADSNNKENVAANQTAAQNGQTPRNRSS